MPILGCSGALALTVASCVACESQADASPAPAGTVVAVNDDVQMLVSSTSSDDTPGMRVSGVLEVIGGNCLGLAPDYGDEALVFPRGTTVTQDGEAVVSPSGIVLAIGDSFEGPGASRELVRSDPWLEELWPTAPTGCSNAQGVLLLTDFTVLEVP